MYIDRFTVKSSNIFIFFIYLNNDGKCTEFIVGDAGDDGFRQCTFCDSFRDFAQLAGHGRELKLAQRPTDRIWLLDIDDDTRTGLLRLRLNEMGRYHGLELFICNVFRYFLSGRQGHGVFRRRKRRRFYISALSFRRRGKELLSG